MVRPAPVATIEPPTIAANAAAPTTPTKLTVDPETDDWESMFDENGDCLDPKLIEEITASVGRVTIESPKSDYTVWFKCLKKFSIEFNLRWFFV